MTDFPPNLPAGAASRLDAILQCMAEDPGFLTDCPYPLEDILVLEKIQGQLVEEDVEIEIVGDDKWSRLEMESNKLFKSLTEFSLKLDSKDNTEQMAYFRTATSLLDKIVGIQERTANLKQISLFHDTVLLIMEDILDAGQRTEVMDRLRQAIKPASANE